MKKIISFIYQKTLSNSIHGAAVVILLSFLHIIQPLLCFTVAFYLHFSSGAYFSVMILNNLLYAVAYLVTILLISGHILSAAYFTWRRMFMSFMFHLCITVYLLLLLFIVSLFPYYIVEDLGIFYYLKSKLNIDRVEEWVADGMDGLEDGSYSEFSQFPESITRSKPYFIKILNKNLYVHYGNSFETTVRYVAFVSKQEHNYYYLNPRFSITIRPNSVFYCVNHIE